MTILACGEKAGKRKWGCTCRRTQLLAWAGSAGTSTKSLASRFLRRSNRWLSVEMPCPQSVITYLRLLLPGATSNKLQRRRIAHGLEREINHVWTVNFSKTRRAVTISLWDDWYSGRSYFINLAKPWNRNRRCSERLPASLVFTALSIEYTTCI